MLNASPKMILFIKYFIQDSVPIELFCLSLLYLLTNLERKLQILLTEMIRSDLKFFFFNLRRVFT
jgi:hypothetical protein